MYYIALNKFRAYMFSNLSIIKQPPYSFLLEHFTVLSMVAFTRYNIRVEGKGVGEVER